jgi:uncharacterized membrane protein
MKKIADDLPDDPPSKVGQLVAAMVALGKYTGANSDVGHAAEIARLGSEHYYRALLVNALLGIAETGAILCESLGGVSADHMLAAHRQALAAAGVADSSAKLLAFLRGRTLRVAGPLRESAQDQTTGPVVLAAAHAAEGLQQLLRVRAAGQYPENADPTTLTVELQAAREALTAAVANIDIMLRLAKQTKDLFR